MKLRKILAGSLAATMALTSSVVMSVTASAATAVDTLAQGKKYSATNLFGTGDRRDQISKVVFNITVGSDEEAAANGQIYFNVGDQNKSNIEVLFATTGMKKEDGSDFDAYVEPGVATDIEIAVPAESSFNAYWYDISLTNWYGSDVTINSIKAFVEDELLAVTPDPVPPMEGTLLNIEKNGTENWQGVESFTVTDFSAATLQDAVDKVGTLTATFTVNGAKSCSFGDYVDGNYGGDYDATKVNYQILFDSHNTSGKGTEWLWIPAGSSKQDGNNVTVTVTAEELAAAIANKKTGLVDVDEAGTDVDLTKVVFNGFKLVAMAALDDATETIRLFHGPITATVEAPTVAPSTFEITAEKATNGKVEVASATAAADADVTVTVTPDEGYELDKLTVTGASGEVKTTAGETAGTYTFKMPAEAVTVTATFKASEYTITDKTAEDANGTVKLSAEKAVAGDEITVTATPADSYALGEITVKTASGKDVTVTEGKFTMPAENVTVTATFKAIEYTITDKTAEDANGTVKLSVDKAAKGTAITVTATPKTGYTLDAITVKTASDKVVTVTDGKFEMPAENVTVTATFKAIEATKVEVTPETANILVGKTAELTAIVTPTDALDKTVTWTSADETIATVKDGVVTGVKAGETKITATCGKLTATCVVKVTDVEVPATEVKLDKETLEITEGDTATLKATATPENTTDEIVWSSSDEKVATVKGGVVTAVAEGEATITVTCGKLTASCKVTVAKKEIPATGVTLDKEALELTEGNTATLKATAAPEDTTDEITWTSSDEKIATVKDGVVTAVAIGEATITVTCGEFTDTCKVTVKGEMTDFVGRLYDIFLDREADDTGLKDWSEKLTTGEATAAEIVHGIAASPEFQAKGLTNAETVEFLYEAMLGRASDEAGKADWVKLLDAGMTVDVVINGFTGSQEFAGICGIYGIKESGTVELTASRDQNYNLTAFISRMYTKALGRTYEVAGLEEWAYHYINNEVDADGLAYGFVFSPEFQNKQLSDSDYVDTLYRTFFNREPDEAGKADWLGRIANGTSREDVLKGFTGSQECANLVASFGLK